MSKTNKPLLRGRFAGETNKKLLAFSSSLRFDKRMYRQDIKASIAHALTLEKAEVITSEERCDIVTSLKNISKEIASDNFPWLEAHEDVHMNIESRLIELIGQTGEKLHSGRSRNDQVATDLRLYLREQVDALDNKVRALQAAILELAKRECETIMPGFTHLQIAQPITFGHHLLAWFEALKRDRDRLSDTRGRVDYLPLGAAALAGTSFPLDREYTAKLLGFEGICANSVDAVSDRDFVIELSSDCALIMMHLSRFCEEIVLWVSPMFNFADLPDELCTGSSIMPQKKNPDIAELIRGKSGRVYGSLIALLTLMKGQPLAYNRDNQEDKEAIFDATDTTKACLEMMELMVAHLRPQREKMAEKAGEGFAGATEMANWLVSQGLTFRRAHEITGNAVRMACERGVALHELTANDFERCGGKELERFPVSSLRPQACVANKNTIGGVSPKQIRLRLKEADNYLRKL